MGVPNMPASRAERRMLGILSAILWLPISFGIATAMHAVLFAKVTSWPAWTQLLHPLATVVAKSKLLVLPVYPAAWPQARKHPFIQLVFNSYETIKGLYVVKKAGFRYRQARLPALRRLRGSSARPVSHRRCGGCTTRTSPNISVSKSPLRN